MWFSRWINLYKEIDNFCLRTGPKNVCTVSEGFLEKDISNIQQVFLCNLLRKLTNHDIIYTWNAQVLEEVGTIFLCECSDKG